MTTYDETDKNNWGDGPWQTEPDHEMWYDDTTDLPCIVLRGPLGSLCGYAGVRPGHPLHGVCYTDIDYANIEVHGGLTYAAECQHGVCHTPREGDTHDIWWFGFDCAHYLDYVPGMEATLNHVYAQNGEERPRLPSASQFETTYKTWGYVTEYTRALARQLHELDQ